MRAPHAWLGVALIVTLYGALLRYEALVVNHGWMGQPRWSETLAGYAVPVARTLRPAHVTWGVTPNPYANGDPINYLRFAREMRHFYQAHVREPVFLAFTRLWLRLTGGRDIGLSFASAAGSALAILATYLLGAAAVSPTVGLIAAFALATEFHAIALSIEGWRDDTFMCVVALAAAALLWLREQPSVGRGVLAGVAAAAACLTRITALSFVAPALVWIFIALWRERAPGAWRGVGAAALTGTLLLAPYLVNCARELGDPLIAINYHTIYYQAAEGRQNARPVSAIGYVAGKLFSRPVGTLDTAAQGLFTFPFANKWHGFIHWHHSLPGLLKWTSAAGLLLALFSPSGRLLLFILIMSLAPYAITWSLGGGGEWRFTQHAYPFYLVCAAWALVAGMRWIVAAARREKGWRPARVAPWALKVGGVAAAVVAASMLHGAMPLLAAREAVGLGEAVTIAAGERDHWFYESGWSDPVRDGVTFRVAQSNVARVRLPVAGRRTFWLTLRIDPAETADPMRQPSVGVFLDRRKIAQLRLTRDPTRMGSYRIQVTTDDPRTYSRLELMASHTVPARDAGPHFAALAPDAQVAFRLWYVRVDPGG